jgi:type I restriction enzyme, S subunit
MIKNWDNIALSEVSEVISKGTTPTTLGHDFQSSGIPFLRGEDINGGEVDSKKVSFHISSKTHSTLSRSHLRSGDLLITIAGTLGRVGYVPKNSPPLNCNQAVAFIRLKPDLVDLSFACFAFQFSKILDSLLDLKKVGILET